MTFSVENIASCCIAGALIIIMTLAAIIIYKVKNKDTWLPSVFIGAATFPVFVLLEGSVNLLMIPLVKDNILLLSIYGGLAAGVFEETGRLVAYKLLMKKHYSTKNAVLMGLGHGGFEAIFLVGIMMFSYAAMAIMVNTMGMEQFMATMNAPDAATEEAMQTLLDTIADYTYPMGLLAVLERVSAITIHTSNSVLVYFAVTEKGFWWLYPAAIIIHALIDAPAVLLKEFGFSTVAAELILLAIAALAAFTAFRFAKYFKKKREQAE